jgi:predicted RNA-binding protein YlqC (UPF0109 family)
VCRSYAGRQIRSRQRANRRTAKVERLSVRRFGYPVQLRSNLRNLIADHDGSVVDAVVDLYLVRFIADVVYVFADQMEKVSLEGIKIFNGFDIILKAVRKDIPCIVGYKERTLKALNLVCKAVGTKTNARISISVKQ